MTGIWLVSRPENGIRPRGLGLAIVSGLGFALFFIFMGKPAAVARSGWPRLRARHHCWSPEPPLLPDGNFLRPIVPALHSA